MKTRSNKKRNANETTESTVQAAVVENPDDSTAVVEISDEVLSHEPETSIVSSQEADDAAANKEPEDNGGNDEKSDDGKAPEIKLPEIPETSILMYDPSVPFNFLDGDLDKEPIRCRNPKHHKDDVMLAIASDLSGILDDIVKYVHTEESEDVKLTKEEYEASKAMYDVVGLKPGDVVEHAAVAGEIARIAYDHKTYSKREAEFIKALRAAMKTERVILPMNFFDTAQYTKFSEDSEPELSICESDGNVLLDALDIMLNAMPKSAIATYVLNADKFFFRKNGEPTKRIKKFSE